MIGPGIPVDMARIGYREWDIDEDTWLTCKSINGNISWSLSVVLDGTIGVTRHVARALLGARKEYTDDSE